MSTHKAYAFDVSPSRWKMESTEEADEGILAAWEPMPDLFGSGARLCMVLGSVYYALLADGKSPRILARGRGMKASDALRHLRKKAEKEGYAIDLIGLED